jgi:WD40 repeat protein
MLATATGDGRITLWDMATSKKITSPDGQLLATGSGDTPGTTAGAPGVVKVWQVATGKVLATVARAITGPGALAFSGQKLANVNADGTVSVRNLVTQAKATILTNASSNAKSVAFRSDGKELMTGNGDGTGTLFDTTTREVTRTLDTGTKAEVPSVAYRRGAGLACAGENLVLWT